jgi:deferrochelatase/peroxidase EfeB
MTVGRREFLSRLAAGTAAAATAGHLLAPEVSAQASQPAGPATNDDLLGTDGAIAPGLLLDPTVSLPGIPFHGRHQAGIITPRQPAAIFASFNVVSSTRREVADGMQALTAVARRLTQGGRSRAHGLSAPSMESGTLGPDPPADGLTVTVSVGHSLFDSRFGLGELKPKRLAPMTPFTGDQLDLAMCGGDMFIQFCAGSEDTTAHALRAAVEAVSPAMQLNWLINGFVAPPRPNGTPRDHFAFKDGIANPAVEDPTVADALLWVSDSSGEPRWAAGGSYHVVRLIQQDVEFWDRTPISEQQHIIGRDRLSGAPLGYAREDAVPDYAADSSGTVIPLTAHMRLANPRTPDTEMNRIFRRSYNYQRGVGPSGNLDVGLVFTSFQQDLERQFLVTQARLIGEPMAEYITTIGGGYFYALSGVVDERDWYGRSLLS